MVSDRLNGSDLYHGTLRRNTLNRMELRIFMVLCRVVSDPVVFVGRWAQIGHNFLIGSPLFQCIDTLTRMAFSCFQENVSVTGS